MDDAVVLLQVLLASPVVNLRAVADVIRNDVGLTIELLKSVCREDSGDQEIEIGIANNVIHAGVDKLKQLAGATKSVSSYMRERSELRKYEHFWGQARLTGLIAEELAYRVTHVDPEEAYVAGSLCRIGELPAILGTNWSGKNCTGSEIGWILARTWGLPRLLQDIACGNKARAAAESLPLLELVQVADRQARRIHGFVCDIAPRVF
ncbi:MAG: HDOD domain-containing protein [Terriglobales bacterium]